MCASVTARVEGAHPPRTFVPFTEPPPLIGDSVYTAGIELQSASNHSAEAHAAESHESDENEESPRSHDREQRAGSITPIEPDGIAGYRIPEESSFNGTNSRVELSDNRVGELSRVQTLQRRPAQVRSSRTALEEERRRKHNEEQRRKAIELAQFNAACAQVKAARADVGAYVQQQRTLAATTGMRALPRSELRRPRRDSEPAPKILKASQTQWLQIPPANTLPPKARAVAQSASTTVNQSITPLDVGKAALGFFIGGIPAFTGKVIDCGSYVLAISVVLPAACVGVVLGTLAGIAVAIGGGDGFRVFTDGMMKTAFLGVGLSVFIPYFISTGFSEFGFWTLAKISISPARIQSIRKIFQTEIGRTLYEQWQSYYPTEVRRE